MQILRNDGRNPVVINLCDLSAEVRTAYLAKSAKESGLLVGEYDEDAHRAFVGVPVSLQIKAYRKAEIAEFMLTLSPGATCLDRVALVQAKFGMNGTSKPNFKRLLKTVEGVDPINFAPALVDNYKGKPPAANLSDQAWSMFLTIIRDAGAEYSLKQAWRDVRKLKKAYEWEWPSYATVMRRWTELSEAQRLSARHGRTEAIKRLSIPAHRDKTSIRSLDFVSLDGRTLDFWTDIGTGKAIRLTMIALFDVASNVCLGYQLARSENAVDTVRLIRECCRKHGIFDRL